jgi:hypothetical protein
VFLAAYASPGGVVCVARPYNVTLAGGGDHGSAIVVPPPGIRVQMADEGSSNARVESAVASV